MRVTAFAPTFVGVDNDPYVIGVDGDITDAAALVRDLNNDGNSFLAALGLGVDEYEVRYDDGDTVVLSSTALLSALR